MRTGSFQRICDEENLNNIEGFLQLSANTTNCLENFVKIDNRVERTISKDNSFEESYVEVKKFSRATPQIRVFTRMESLSSFVVFSLISKQHLM